MFKSGSSVISKLYKAVRKRILTFIAGIAFALICFIMLNVAMVPVSKSEYCGGKCHEMSTAYRTWELSSHGANNTGIRVECIDCHLPSKDKYFTHMTAKAYAGAKDIYKHYFGDEYNIEKMRQQVLSHMPNQRCLNCHDDLLTKPGSSAARIAHVASLADPDVPENKCIQCHEDTGHP